MLTKYWNLKGKWKSDKWPGWEKAKCFTPFHFMLEWEQLPVTHQNPCSLFGGKISRLCFPAFLAVSHGIWLGSSKQNMGRSGMHHFQTWSIKISCAHSSVFFSSPDWLGWRKPLGYNLFRGHMLKTQESLSARSLNDYVGGAVLLTFPRVLLLKKKYTIMFELLYILESSCKSFFWLKLKLWKGWGVRGIRTSAVGGYD